MDKQKAEGLVSAAVDFGMTAFNLRFRLICVIEPFPVNGSVRSKRSVEDRHSCDLWPHPN